MSNRWWLRSAHHAESDRVLEDRLELSRLDDLGQPLHGLRVHERGQRVGKVVG